MALLNSEALLDLKSKVNIVDVISQYVALSKNGKNYSGLCPFHGEKTPSFNVNAEKGFYHCFGCGKSGDVIEFLKEYKQIGFKDAVVELASFAGVNLVLPEKNQVKENPNQAILDVNNQAARLYHIVLMSTELGEKARAYLLERGITQELIKRYNIGLSPDENDFIFQNLSSKFDEKVMANSGLFHFSNQKVFDAFSNRIMFPIMNEFGQTIGFSGRKWQSQDTSKAKYINTSQTPVFDKSFELWNFDKAKPFISRHHEVYLMEGFMDVIAADKAGIQNVVASMGTALTEQHVRRLKKVANQFVLVYDGDDAGQNAIYKAMQLIGESDVTIVKIPEKMDPDDYQKHYGPVELERLMKQGRIHPIEFLIEFLRPSNLAQLQSQIDFIDRIAPMIAQVSSITAQDAFIRKLVEILPDFEYNQVENAVNLRRENVRNKNQGVTDVLSHDDEMIPPAPDFPDDSYFEAFEAPQNRQNQAFNGQGQTAKSALDQQTNRHAAVEIAEEHLIHRMIYHPSVLKRFAQDEAFRFVHQNFQLLFEKIMIEAMSFDQLDPNHFAMTLDEDLRALFYEIISLDLPQELSGHEIDDLLEKIENDQVVSQLDELFKALDEAHKAGNMERELELTVQIINQKKKIK